MDFNALIERGLLYFQHNKVVGLAVLAALCLFGYLKPKQFFKLLLLALLLGAVLYIVSLLGESSETGVRQKDQVLNKSQELLK